MATNTGPGWDALRAKTRRAAELAVKAGAAHMLRAVGDTLDAASPGGGRVYQRAGGRTHQASLPGQPWASDTGSGRQSITVDYQGESGGVYSARVGPATAAAPATPGGETPANYLRDLEYGTRRIAARPTFRPTAQREAGNAQAVMRKVFEREIKRR